jgi:hypothetical protein
LFSSPSRFLIGNLEDLPHVMLHKHFVGGRA